MKNFNKIFIILVFVLNLGTLVLGQTQRVTDDLQVLYDFSETSGTTVNDISNVGAPLNLAITNSNLVTWKNPGLKINGDINVKSSVAATKVISACKTTNEVTYEAWFIPQDTTRDVVSRMLTLTNNNIHTTNLKFWQLKNDFGFHCRTSTSPENGYEWKIFNFDVKLTHFVFTHRADGVIKLYWNNEIVAQDTVTGDFSTWDDSYFLFIGSDYGTFRYWLGTFFLNAIYSKALTDEQVEQNYLAGLQEYDYQNITINDITTSNLIGDAYNSGKYGGHGVMFADVDNDQDPDMYITMNNSAAMADLFFENNGSGVFTEKGVERGIDNFDTKGSHGWVWADLDNDGDYDGWNGSYTKNIPYMNKNDQLGYFVDKFSLSGIEDINMSTRGVAAFDFDNDGDLDLFGNSWYATSEENEFYRNDGDFIFTRIDNGLRAKRGDQGVCDGDIDNDGDMDLVLCVYQGNLDGRCVEIMENINGQFVKLENTGLDLCNASYDGVTLWDLDSDGLLDIVSGEKIFKNNGNKTFTEVSYIPQGSTYIYMRGIADLNNDGFWDLIVPGVGTAFINKGDMTFQEINYSVGTVNDPRTVSFADIDNDGDVDFALGQKRIYNRLYRNDYGGTNKYLKVKLKTADGQIGAFGAKVYLYSINGDSLISFRQAHSNQGYLSQDDPVLHFGCGQRDQVKLVVVFLSGHSIEYIVNTNQIISINDFYPDITPPATPILLSTSIIGDGIKLTWKKNNEQDLMNYNIYRSLDSTFTNDSTNTFLVSTIDTFYTDFSLEYGNKYFYGISAIDSTGNESELSELLSARVIDITSPSKPNGFSLEKVDNKVKLFWDKNSENDIQHYIIYRSFENNFNPDTMSTFTYSTTDTFFVDSDVNYNATIYYIIAAVDIHDNTSEFSNIISVIVTDLDEISQIPLTFELYQNYPNPFNPSTMIKFSIKEESFVNLSIFNILGENVKVLLNKKMRSGFYEMSFNALDLKSGIYFYKLSTENFTDIKKMILLK
ncbi:MAG: VCBS repeat-containing protein [Ignavibacteriae bacterium]|nr:VCBS repeat-containing protein [Ignavibacteriota bacterium]